MDSPTTSRKQLVIYTPTRQQSLPPNLRQAPTRGTIVPRASSVASDLTPLKEVRHRKSPGRSLAKKDREGHELKIKPKIKRTKLELEPSENSCTEQSLLKAFANFCKNMVLMLATVLIVVGAAILMKHLISMYIQKWTCKGKFTINYDHFEQELRDNLFGQHIAKDVILSALPEYLGNDVTDPLVIIMNGWTGVGKNHISNIIASEFNTTLGKIIFPLHFPHADKNKEHFYLIQTMVEQYVKRCRINIILIDEIDKASSGAIFGLITVLNKLKETMNHSGAKTIVLLLSNSFGQYITDYVYQETVVKLRQRSSLTYNEMSSLFSRNVDYDDVTWYKALWDSGLVNFTIPFLPLAKKHVHLCVYRDLRLKQIGRVTPAIIDNIANELTYYPEQEQVFSKTGCKRVSDKVNYILL